MALNHNVQIIVPIKSIKKKKKKTYTGKETTAIQFVGKQCDWV